MHSAILPTTMMMICVADRFDGRTLLNDVVVVVVDPVNPCWH